MIFGRTCIDIFAMRFFLGPNRGGTLIRQLTDVTFEQEPH